MSKCPICNKDIVQHVFIGIDGDAVCSEECKKKWEQQRDDFYDRILPNDELFDNWMHGEEV